MVHTTFDYAARLSVSLLPVVVFLLGLVYLDTFRLMRVWAVLAAVAVGCAAAGLSLPIHRWTVGAVGRDSIEFARYGAPAIEELLKAACVGYVIWTRRVGFLVDSAITGFAVGAGFAIVENTYYIGALDGAGAVVWVIRGFGTALMHGGATAVFAIVSKLLHDRGGRAGAAVFVPGLLVAFGLHAVYNRFVVPPLLSALAVDVVLVTVVLAVFYYGERSMRRWLGRQLDVDTELLGMIRSGRASRSRAGAYLQAAKATFRPEIVFDMVCYVRLRVELSIGAKGMLLMREAGFDPGRREGLDASLDELRHLEEVIGKTGLRVLRPLFHSSRRDPWQLHMLGE